jgi:hypothetical protein
MKGPGFLPKFGSSKNPFARPPKTDSVKPAPTQMETDSLFENEPKKASAPIQKAPVVKETKPIVEPEKKIEAKPVAAAPAAPATTVAPAAPAAPVAKQAKTGRLAGLLKKLNPLAHLPKRQPGARSAKPKAARAAVQGELSLEKVRVVRNELNDCDIEFVTTKTVVSTGTTGTILPERPRPGLSTWGRLTSRVIGAAETQTH